jgi:hypothetical protein
MFRRNRAGRRSAVEAPEGAEALPLVNVGHAQGTRCALARLLNKWPKHTLRVEATLSAPAEFGWGALLCGQKKLGNWRRGPTHEVQWAPYGLAHVTSWALIKVVKALFLVMGHADRRFIKASGFLSCWACRVIAGHRASLFS